MTHSRAGKISATVDITENRLRAVVEDDGRGFEAAEGASRDGGTGLTSMKERTSLLGGTLNLASDPGEGTRIEVFVPLPGRRR